MVRRVPLYDRSFGKRFTQVLALLRVALDDLHLHSRLEKLTGEIEAQIPSTADHHLLDLRTLASQRLKK